MQNYESTYDLTRIISIDISLTVGLKDLLLAHNRRNIRVLVTRVNIDFYRLFFQPLLKSNFIEKHRRSHRRRSVNKIALKNFSKFTRKRLYWSLFFNKVAGLRPTTQVFSCEFCKIFKNNFFVEHLRTSASGSIIPAWYHLSKSCPRRHRA